jgi:16S rRNA (cytosine1402-N4)-methyltransferase
MSNYHIPVLLNEVINGFSIKPDKRFIDCTMGGGGHTEEILKNGGKVLAIDQDDDAIEEVTKRLQNYINTDKLIVQKGNFKNLKEIAVTNNFTKVDGILFDLGVSTHQLEKSERGFSFNSDAPLDMRMDRSKTVTASDLVNGLNKGELYELFTKLGEEHYARPIAEAIVRARSIKPITKCNELANVILTVRKRSGKDRTHPATRIFQALRIAVNDELNVLREVLPDTLELVKKDGKIIVISFHSLEDRIVKQFFIQEEVKGVLVREPEKPIGPTEEEVNINPRARSAKLRIARKVN